MPNAPHGHRSSPGDSDPVPVPPARPTVEEHLAEVRALLAPVLERWAAEAPELVGIDDPGLLGRVTATPVRAPHPLPPFDNSQMDGYAVRVSDLAGAAPGRPVGLPVGRATAAGDPPAAHAPGTASPVMTGAPIPAGADAVVPIEAATPAAFPQLSRAGDPAPTGTVSFVAAPAPGAFVRATGVDVSAGAELLPAGSALGPARIGLLAAAGIAEVPVRRRIRVLLCSTGDELAGSPATRDADDPAGGGSVLAPGRIHDANTPMLAAALRAAGAEVRGLRAPDRPDALRAAVLREAGDADLVVTSGGISAGAFEVVRETFAALGARFRGIAMQPGGPQGLGTLAFDEARESIAAVCFPGNPVSALISAEVFLLPALRAAVGRAADRPRERRALAHDVVSPADKHQVRRGRIEDDGRVSLSAPGSHLLADLAGADVLAHLPVGVDGLPEHAEIDVWRLDD
ncbi:molybdopterin molybdenumtransferase MoeA [Leucobacter zeae]|nr:molybdopterin molybdenumtransferase MoeA [Leucobacter zeae]